MHRNCIICGSEGIEKVYNNLPLFECTSCELLWRQNFDLDIEHYAHKNVEPEGEKKERRISNCRDRVKTFSRYIDLNNLCDVGSGEGIFVQMLNTRGYTGCIGIEPGNTSAYAKKHNLTILRGALEDATHLFSSHHIQTASLFHVIEHLKDPLCDMQSLREALPPGGRLIVETPDIQCAVFKRLDFKHPLIYKEHLFYFSKKSLVLLLEKAGFTIVATGKRDFDVYHTPIKELLFKLGLYSKITFKNTAPFLSEKISETDLSFKHKKSKSALSYWMRTLLQKVLAYIVEKTQRTDYLWIIAKRG